MPPSGSSGQRGALQTLPPSWGLRWSQSWVSTCTPAQAFAAPTISGRGPRREAVRPPSGPSRDRAGRDADGQVPQDKGPAAPDPPTPSMRPGQNLESTVLLGTQVRAEGGLQVG